MRRKMNWAQARKETDTGRTHDKVNHPDPAAAPLGTDEEAGGATTPPEDIAASVEGRKPGFTDRKSQAHDDDSDDKTPT